MARPFFKANLSFYVQTILIAALVFAGGWWIASPNKPAQTETTIASVPKETALSRIAPAKTLRCAYIVIPPEFNKDPNSGKLSGFSYDVAEEMGRRLGWKIEWSEEVNFMTMASGFDANRYDALCFSLYRYSPTAALFDYSVPLFYTGTGIYVRADDHRFDQNPTLLNNPAAKLATIDSEMSSIIARENFPQAQTMSMPQNTDLTQMMMAVEAGKADATFANSAVASPYLAANPGKLRDIAQRNPIRLFSHGFAFKKGETELLSTVNYVFEEMINDGTMDRLLAAHEKIPGTFLRPAKPYQSSGPVL